MDLLGRHVWKVPFILILLVVTVKATANKTTLIQHVEAGGLAPIHGSAKANNSTHNQNVQLGDFAHGSGQFFGPLRPRTTTHHGLLCQCRPCPPCDKCRLPPPPPPQVGPAPPPPEVGPQPPAPPTSPPQSDQRPPPQPEVGPAVPPPDVGPKPQAPPPPTANATINTTTAKAKDKIMTQRQKAVAGLKIAGYGITMLPYVLPFAIARGTGSLYHTSKFYSELNLACTALSSYGWLMYSVVQVSYKDQQEVIGIEAIIVNAVNFGVSGFMLAILLYFGRQGKGMVCLGVMFIHTTMILSVVQFPILRLVEKDGSMKTTVGIIAGAFQASSALLPMIKLLVMWLKDAPQGGYEQIRHFKKFIIIMTGVDSVTTIYWMLYCVFTYKLDEFGWSSIGCAALSLTSFVAHCAWAVKP